MKNLAILFVLTILLSFTSCNEKVSAQESEVLSPKEFHEATAGKNVQLLDVRTSKEFEEAHLKHAVNIDVLESDFSDKAKNLDKDQPLYLYCRSGNRSAKASAILKDMGFKEIYDMEGGFLLWDSEGLESEN